MYTQPTAPNVESRNHKAKATEAYLDILGYLFSPFFIQIKKLGKSNPLQATSLDARSYVMKSTSQPAGNVVATAHIIIRV